MRRTAALAVLVSLLVGVTACGDGAGDDAVEARAPAATWTRLPDPPIAARTAAVGVWTGSEVIVMGGDEFRCPPTADCAGPAHPPLRDGAAYSPATGGWRRIADAPVPFAWAATAVVDGDVYVATFAWSGRAGARAALLRYRPVDDAWTEVARPPAAADAGYGLVAVDDRLVAFTTTEERGASGDWILDGERWVALPADPMTPAFDRTMVGVGDRLVLLDKEHVPNPGSERPSVTRAAVLDLPSMTWQRLPDSEMLGSGPWLVDGDRIVHPWLGGADGGEVNGWGRTYPNGGILDVGTGTWSPLPGVTPDTEVYEAGSVIGEHGALYSATRGRLLDLRTGTWSTMPPLDDPALDDPALDDPAHDDPGQGSGWSGVDGRTIVAAGRDLFAFGGTDWTHGGGGRLLADAWVLPAP